MTGPQSLDLADIARLLTDLRGKPVFRQVITDDTLTDRMAAAGAPQAAVEMTLGLYRAARAREFTAVDPTLERLLGRPAALIRDVLAESQA